MTKIAVVGFGFMGRMHYGNWKRIPGARVAAIGEVGLTGEVRSVSHLGQRLSEVQRLGFESCIIPKLHADRLAEMKGLKLIPVQNIADALRAIARS